jgi:hypothetical protein
MSASTFRIIIIVLLGTFLYWFIKGQVKLIENLEAQTNPTIDIDADDLEQAKGELPEPVNPIGFRYSPADDCHPEIVLG